MATADSMLNLSQEFLSPDIVQKVSDVIGQSTEKTKEGLKSIIPAFMSGVVDKGSTPEGAATIVDLVKTHNFESVALPDETKLSEGNDVVNSIFGSNLNNVVSKLGTSTGLSTASVTKMLNLIAPVFMGVLGSKVKKEELNSSGLMNFLQQQKNSIAGLGAKVSDYYSMAAKPAAELPKHLTQEIPWRKILLAALVLLAIWFWWQSTHQKTYPPIIITSTPTERAVIKLVPVTPSLKELSAFMVEGTTADLPKHFRFEKLTFARASTALVPGAGAELDKIASVMKEYPNSRARLEGFTDNVGPAEVNRVLSERRALAVKEQLIARGIDASRLQTVGMGAENPIGNNATAKGRAKNRRIEFVVTNIK